MGDRSMPARLLLAHPYDATHSSFPSQIRDDEIWRGGIEEWRVGGMRVVRFETTYKKLIHEN